MKLIIFLREAVLSMRRHFSISLHSQTLQIRLSSFLILLNTLFFLLSHTLSCLSFPASHLHPPPPPRALHPPLRSSCWGGRWCVRVRYILGPGEHFLLSQPITLTCSHTVNWQTGLTVVPSRSSPEAGTCRGPRRCGWSGPPLAWESDRKTNTGSGGGGGIKDRWPNVWEICDWRVWRLWTQSAASPRMTDWKMRGMLTTHLQADPVFRISLLAFRRGEHWRDGHVDTKRKGDGEERKGEKWEDKMRERKKGHM